MSCFRKGRRAVGLLVLVLALPGLAPVGCAWRWPAAPAGSAGDGGGWCPAAPVQDRGLVPLQAAGELALPPLASRPIPSPRGDLFVYYLRGAGDVARLADRDGGDRGRLPGDEHYGPASWSPDGKWLAYYTGPGGTGPRAVAGRIMVYCADDGSSREVPIEGLEPGATPLPVFSAGNHLLALPAGWSTPRPLTSGG